MVQDRVIPSPQARPYHASRVVVADLASVVEDRKCQQCCLGHHRRSRCHADPWTSEVTCFILFVSAFDAALKICELRRNRW